MWMTSQPRYNADKLVKKREAYFGTHDADTVDVDTFCDYLWQRLNAAAERGEQSVTTAMSGSLQDRHKLFTAVRERFARGYNILYSSSHRDGCPNGQWNLDAHLVKPYVESVHCNTVCRHLLSVAFY
jgi:hypothetical protein